MVKKTGWYHSCGDSCEPEIKFFTNGPDFSEEMYFQSGPFKTFSEAKQDAVAYF